MTPSIRIVIRFVQQTWPTTTPVKAIKHSVAPLQAGTARRAFTLFEAVLALALSVVLMGLVSFAIRFYSRDMAESDEEIRRMQLVTAVMQMIEDDLRSTLHTEPVDTAGLESLLSSSAGDATGTGAGAGQGGGGTDTADDTDLTSEEVTTDSLTAGLAVLESPGLLGNQTQIQFDVSRLPRLEEYIPMLEADPSQMTDVPSDIKTISYFVQAPGTVTGVNDEFSAFASDGSFANGGLIRRSVDRAASAFAVTSGNISQLNSTGDLLASEITALQFEYWDGFIWQIEWNSDELGELPLAVRVTLAMAETSDASGSDADSVEIRQFQHIIRLPIAKPIEEEDESLTGAAL